MQTPRIRITIAVLLAAVASAGLGGCAAPAPTPTAPPGTAAETPAPTPSPEPRDDLEPATWQGVDCARLVPLDVIRDLIGADAVEQDPAPQSPAEATLAQSGTKTCTWGTSDGESGVWLGVLAQARDAGTAQLSAHQQSPFHRADSSSMTACGMSGDAGRNSQCLINQVIGDLWAQATIWSDRTDLNESFFDASPVLEETMGASISNLQPGEAWDPPASSWRLDTCEELDADRSIASAVGFDELRFYHRSRGADDAMTARAWEATGFLLCAARSDEGAGLASYGPSLQILPGGAWAFRGLTANDEWTVESIAVDGADDAIRRCSTTYDDHCVIDAVSNGNWVEQNRTNELLTDDQLVAALSATLRQLDSTVS